jgi:hypothetical protein
LNRYFEIRKKRKKQNPNSIRPTRGPTGGPAAPTLTLAARAPGLQHRRPLHLLSPHRSLSPAPLPLSPPCFLPQAAEQPASTQRRPARSSPVRVNDPGLGAARRVPGAGARPRPGASQRGRGLGGPGVARPRRVPGVAPSRGSAARAPLPASPRSGPARPWRPRRGALPCSPSLAPRRARPGAFPARRVSSARPRCPGAHVAANSALLAARVLVPARAPRPCCSPVPARSRRGPGARPALPARPWHAASPPALPAQLACLRRRAPCPIPVLAVTAVCHSSVYVALVVAKVNVVYLSSSTHARSSLSPSWCDRVTRCSSRVIACGT